MDPSKVEEDVLAVLLIVRRMGSSLADRGFVSPSLKAAESVGSPDHDW